MFPKKKKNRMKTFAIFGFLFEPRPALLCVVAVVVIASGVGFFSLADLQYSYLCSV